MRSEEYEKRINKAQLYFICLAMFLFQPIIERIIGVFRYYDEALVVMLFVDYSIRKRFKMFDIALLGGLLLIITTGLIGNALSQSEQPTRAVLQDVFSNSKLILIAIAAKGITLSDKQKEKLSDYLSNLIRFLFFILFITAVVSLFVDIGMTTKERYGIKAYRFLFDNAGILNTYYYYYIIIFSITMYKNGKLRNNTLLFLIMSSIPWVLTLRARAFGFALLYIVLFIYIVYFRKSNTEYRFRWYYVLIVIGSLLVLSWDSIEKYFISNDRISRYQLFRKSFEIARDYFPLGSGFGTFGTQASRDYYSSIYNRYGLSTIYGLNPEHPAFVTDQYWFGIIGQFGVIGLIIMLCIIYKIYKNIWNDAKFEKNMQLAAITLFFTSVFASLTAASFIHTTIVPSIMLLYIFNKNRNAE